MSKYLTLTLLFGALVFASLSGGDKDAESTSAGEATVISDSETASQAAEIITGDVSAYQLHQRNPPLSTDF